MTFRELLEKYNNKEYNSSRTSMIEMGWYDWWAADETLLSKFEHLMPYVCKLAETGYFDLDNTTVSFKETCPAVGPLYRNFFISEINGDGFWWFGHLTRGSYGENYSGWEFEGDNTKIRNWKNIIKHFAI